MDNVMSARMGAARKTSIAIVVAAILLLSGVVAVFGQESEGTAKGSTVATTECLSGMKWTSGENGSPEMHPGTSCIDCHAKGEGPRFLVAGTVYQKLNEPDDCYGVEGVVVQLTDAKGQVIKMTTNKAGNFNVRARGTTIDMPFTAKITFNGAERRMLGPKSTGNCASCHAAKGLNGAPGRIIAP